MLGLMQDWPLTLDRIIDHAAREHGRREVVSRSVKGPLERTSYAEIRARAKRVSSVLLEFGIRPGDRVATLAWNTARHLEVWYGVMGIGVICHTLNPRLSIEQLIYVINHAQDRLMFVDSTFLPILAAIRDQIPCVEKVIVLSDRDSFADQMPAALAYERLLDTADAAAGWGGFDENTAAGLCYTSGTTGDPKGVLYSHRSNFLHSLVTLGSDVLALQATDTVLPIVPMFHANAWGLAFSAPAVGAKLVMAAAKLDGASIHELLEREAVTFSAAVPTVWAGLLEHLRATGAALSTLRRVVIGGAAVPESLLRAFEDDYGVEVVHAWGMTEISPLGALNAPVPETLQMDQATRSRKRLRQGRAPLGVELALVDDDNLGLARDGKAVGRLKVRGAFVAKAYFGRDETILDGEGFFDTGDVATIDPDGVMAITDRAKDVIKSGGEWISSIEIENVAASHPSAALTAVIGLPHPKWDERPLLLVKLKPGEAAEPGDFLQHLEGKIPRWWMPDEVRFVDEIPLGATGKVDKKAVRRIWLAGPNAC